MVYLINMFNLRLTTKFYLIASIFVFCFQDFTTVSGRFYFISHCTKKKPLVNMILDYGEQ